MRVQSNFFVGCSDRSIYKRLGLHKWKHVIKSAPHRAKNIKQLYPNLLEDDNQLIEWFKESNGKLVPNELEIIPRKDWNMLEQVGEIESSLMSPHKWTFFDYICKNPVEKKKILVVFECCNSKPYCQDSMKKWYLSRFRTFCDFTCGAYGLVPEEYSMLYPVREDEWSHSAESELVGFKYNVVSCSRGYDYIKSQGYEHVIVYFQNPQPEEFLKWMSNIDDDKVKFHFVVTPELLKQLEENYPQLGNGMRVMRLVNLTDSRITFMNTLQSILEGEDLERFLTLRDIIETRNDKMLKRWLKENNEKFGIEEYRTDKPTWECKLKEVPNKNVYSDLDENIQQDLIDWVRKNLKDFEEKKVFTPLDLLIKKYNISAENPLLKDVDKLYWNLMKVIEDNQEELEVQRLENDKFGRYKYLFVFNKYLEVENKKDLMTYCDKNGYSQFYQDVQNR